MTNTIELPAYQGCLTITTQGRHEVAGDSFGHYHLIVFINCTHLQTPPKTQRLYGSMLHGFDSRLGILTFSTSFEEGLCWNEIPKPIQNMSTRLTFCMDDLKFPGT